MRRILKRTFNRRAAIVLGSVAFFAAVEGAAETIRTDLLDGGADDWRQPAPGWRFAADGLHGASALLDGAKTDPAASRFLVSRKTFGGDLAVDLEVSFDAGRYLGVYLDFGQESQSGIWMATGHPLAADAPDNEVEHAYIKTVDDSVWVVRATGELVVRRGEPLRLRFAREGDDYRIYSDGVLVATYRKPGGYPPGPLQLRLTNARATIHRLEVTADWSR